VASCCEYGGEPSGSCATELVLKVGQFIYERQINTCSLEDGLL
jgi:hypothetical protein